MLDRVSPKYDEREINRKAVQFWPQVYSLIVDMHGRPLPEISRLGDPGFDPSRPRKAGEVRPQLNIFKGIGPMGQWRNIGAGAQGENIVDLIVYLSGGADRRVCAEWLGRLVDSFAEVELR